jgi:NADH:ubiquinone oxidoreductase subunit 4 (subunit M)
VTQEEYLEQRLDDQLDWYDRKSSWNQKWYKRLQLILLVAAATIPFLSGFATEVPVAESGVHWVNIAIGLLGVIMTAIAAALGLYNFQENWIKYRTTSESLQKEKYKFLTGVSPYDGDNAFKILVEHVEGLISKENTDWSQQMQNAKEKINP